MRLEVDPVPMRLLLTFVLFGATSVAAQPQLTGQAAALYGQARGGRWFADSEKLKPDVRPTTDGKSFFVIWKAGPEPTRWIVSLHGTQGFATDDLALWSREAKGRDVGVLCLQWWLGAGGAPSAYYTPQQAYREIAAALEAAGAKPGAVMFHGFSRGSANSYAIVALDAARGKRYFSLAVASSGAVSLDYPPTRAIANGDLGLRPLQGTRWITSAGARDPNPDTAGVAGMRRTAAWLREQGAIVMEAIEDASGGHGALQTNPRNTRRVLDLFLNGR